MSETDLRVLRYGEIDTQFGLTCEDLPDGGIVITIPSTTWSYACRITPVPFPASLIWIVARYVAAKLTHPQLPSRAVIELTSKRLSITEADSTSSSKTVEGSWPLAEVAEVRPNRYGRGLYVRIPGKQNFDVLGDLHRPLIEHVGNRLSAALERVRPTRMVE